MYQVLTRLALVTSLLLTAVSAPQALAAPYASPYGKPYAQGLVDRVRFIHPEVLRIDLIATPPGSKRMEVIASTVPAAAGKPATTAQIATTETPACQALAATLRAYRCVLSLHDTPGAVVGSLVIDLPYFPGQSTEQVTRDMLVLARLFAETTPDLASLFDEMSVTPKPDDLLSQCMVLDILAHNPDLMVLAMHVTPAGESVNKMLAINEPRFWGKTSEASEELLSKTGNILVDSFNKTHRVETHVAILAADDTLLGTLATVYFWRTPDEIPGFVQKSLQIQQELKPQIKNLATLYQPCGAAPVRSAASR